MQNFYTDGWQFGWVGGGGWGCTTSCVLKDVDNPGVNPILALQTPALPRVWCQLYIGVADPSAIEGLVSTLYWCCRPQCY